METKISQKGWVVIPADIRRKYHLNAGVKVRFVDYGGVIAMIPIPQNPIGKGLGMLAGAGRSLTQALMDEHEEELRNEER